MATSLPSCPDDSEEELLDDGAPVGKVRARFLPRKLDTAKTSSMDVESLNTLVVGMRKFVRMARVRTIHKLTRTIKKLKTKKGKDEEVAKSTAKAEKLAEEVVIIKAANADRVSKFALSNTFTLDQVCKKEGASVQLRALTRLVEHEKLKAAVKKWRTEHDDWQELSAFLSSKNTGRRFRKKKKKVTAVSRQVDKALLKETLKTVSGYHSDEGVNDEDHGSSGLEDGGDEGEQEKSVHDECGAAEEENGDASEHDSVGSLEDDASDCDVGKEVADSDSVQSYDQGEDSDGAASSSGDDNSDDVVITRDAGALHGVKASHSDSRRLKSSELQNAFLASDDAHSNLLGSDDSTDVADDIATVAKNVDRSARVKEGGLKLGKKGRTTSSHLAESEQTSAVGAAESDFVVDNSRGDMVVATFDLDGPNVIDGCIFVPTIHSAAAENAHPASARITAKKKSAFFECSDNEAVGHDGNESDPGDSEPLDNGEADSDGEHAVRSTFTGCLRGKGGDRGAWRSRGRGLSRGDSRNSRARGGRGQTLARGGRATGNTFEGQSQRRGDSHYAGVGGPAGGGRQASFRGRGSAATAEKLHPSWEASRKRKELEKTTIQPYAGKKIKFEDD